MPAQEPNREQLGPAEKIIETALTWADHMVHNRPGVVTDDPSVPGGKKWQFCTHRDERPLGAPETAATTRVVYLINRETASKGKGKKGKKMKSTRKEFGVIPMHAVAPDDHGRPPIVNSDGQTIGFYQPPGLFPEIAVWLYRQVATVYGMSNVFAAKWASYQFERDHRDLKVVLAAFMLVQSRKGEPVREADGSIAFYDDDFRDVGEAMMLHYGSSKKKGASTVFMTPRMLVRIRELLDLPGVKEINRELGFTSSNRSAATGRWSKAVHKWLAYRETNVPLLNGLASAGLSSTVRTLASRSGYKPASPKFFEILRWKQKQAKDGRRRMAIGRSWKGEDWSKLNEEQICERIIEQRPAWSILTSYLPSSIGVTKAIMACAIQTGCLSLKQIVILTPTIEEFGLLEDPDVKRLWDLAVKNANDLRVANIAERVRDKDTREKLTSRKDEVVAEAVAEVVQQIRVYVFVDVSASMEDSIEEAIELCTTLLPAIPLDRLHVAVFNTVGAEVTIRAQSAAAVKQAFRGVNAGGGTHHGMGVNQLAKYRPAPGEDVLFIFVGDEQDHPFADWVRNTGLDPKAFGFLYVPGNMGHIHHAVTGTAAALGIPCFSIDRQTFSDPYAVPRTIHALIASTPVGRIAVGAPQRAQAARKSLVETILGTKLLEKPTWA